MEKKYNLQLTLEDGRYIILEDKKNKEYIGYMLNWYNAHKDFYNGTFKIVENN